MSSSPIHSNIIATQLVDSVMNNFDYELQVKEGMKKIP